MLVLRMGAPPKCGALEWLDRERGKGQIFDGPLRAPSQHFQFWELAPLRVKPQLGKPEAAPSPARRGPKSAKKRVSEVSGVPRVCLGIVGASFER